jgi:hypothetical protein
MLYYKFRSVEDAERDIREKRLRISRYRSLNDPYELMGIASARATFIAGIKRTVDEFNDMWGITCFSGNWNDPVMWSHYSCDHKGIALGFEFPTLTPDKVNYDEHPIPEKEWIDQYHKDPEGSVKAWFLRKYLSWKYEDEYRFISELKEPDPILTQYYFVEFGPTTLELREVVMGVRCTKRMAEMRRLLNSAGLLKVKIIKAELSTTDFKVVASRISRY